MSQKQDNTGTIFHFERPRLNRLLAEAVKYPLTLVCAGAGYGKTSMIHDFAREYKAAMVWIQLSERDNVASRFWENFIHAAALINKPFAMAIGKMDFPNTKDKQEQYLALMRSHVELKERIIVLDDFHVIENPGVINFVERIITDHLPGTSLLLLSRSSPRINIAAFVSRGRIFNISESDLLFTDDELAQYFRSLNIALTPENLREIMRDTEGWAFAINLIALSYGKAPGYGGYLRNAMKSNIFALMETQIWEGLSGSAQVFIVQLSLIDHLSFELVMLLAGKDSRLITELEKQNAYLRRDGFIHAYVIHHLFLEFLQEKQSILTDEIKLETYSIAADWCDKNGFKLDAMSYYEKTGDYASIMNILNGYPAQIPMDVAKYAADIIDRAPEEAFERNAFLPIRHLHCYVCQCLWTQCIKLAEYYEAKYLKLPENDAVRNRVLSGIYYCWGYTRILMCISDHRYDFDIYFEKYSGYPLYSEDIQMFTNHNPGLWINAAGSSRKGSLEEYIASLGNMIAHLSRHFNGLKIGECELAMGELEFYRGDLNAAEIYITRSLNQGRESKQFEVAHRALLYTIRLGVAKGDFAKAENALGDLKAQLNEEGYFNRYINYDIALSWYYCLLGMSEKTSDWLKQSFSPYAHAGFAENFANQVKARYCYAARIYPPLLSYIEEMKQRESYLYGRVEMLAMEACVHYKMKNKRKAFVVFQEAYESASPNDLIMPFIELGKDMRTLASTALKDASVKIPASWLENINRKAASYAKRQTHIITKYKQANSIKDGVVLTPRETDILNDLSHGLSRAEIADSRNLSINTVKMVINNIYIKMGAENTADLIRIAVERKMI